MMMSEQLHCISRVTRCKSRFLDLSRMQSRDTITFTSKDNYKVPSTFETYKCSPLLQASWCSDATACAQKRHRDSMQKECIWYGSSEIAETVQKATCEKMNKTVQPFTNASASTC